MEGLPKKKRVFEKFAGPNGEMIEIRDVWADNLLEEMENIRQIVDDYPFVSMDTEFPGVVARPLGSDRSADYNYQLLRCNVDLLKIIQLGLSFTNDKGEFPPGCNTWQFNFAFDIETDMHAQDSIDLLTRSGIVFDNLTRDGIDVRLFGELLTSSGLVLSDDVCWISFHSGYDFGYLLKVLTAKALPGVEDEFFKLLQTFFPKIYDIKHLMRNCDNKLKGGLNKVAEDLLVPRIGPMHQAGSDSLLTASTFFKMRESFFAADDLTDPRWVGVLYGYGPGKEDRERR